MDLVNNSNNWKEISDNTKPDFKQQEVKKGEIHSIIGPNGAGKTVMMNCINGLYKPQQGEIHYKGQKINDLKPYLRAELGISRTFQKIELFGGMTVLDNIRLGRHIHLKSGIISGAIYVGKTKQEELSSRKFIEEEIIDLLEIESIRHKTVHMLPYGLQKRVELGRALALNPDLLLLDEPLGALDAKLREGMQIELKQLHNRIGATILYVTHDQEEALTLSDRIVVFNDGKIMQVGTPDDLYRMPQNRFVADFIGKTNFLIGKVSSTNDKICRVQLEDGIAMHGPLRNSISTPKS